jgi:hypothetical protein
LTDLSSSWAEAGAPVDDTNRSGGALHLEVEAAKKFVPCPVCERQHANVDVLRATAESPIQCACGEVLRIRTDNELSWPRGTRLFGEGAEPTREKKETIAISCASCGGKLDADGATRSVTCKYCQTQNALDEEVWRRLHPVRRIRRFAVLIDDAALKAEEEEEARAMEERRETKRAAHERDLEHRVANLNALPRPRALPAWAPRPSPIGVVFVIVAFGIGAFAPAAMFPNGLFITLVCAVLGIGVGAVVLGARRSVHALRHGEIVCGEVKKSEHLMTTSKQSASKRRLTIEYRWKGRARKLQVDLRSEHKDPARSVKVGARVYLAVEAGAAAIYSFH